MNILETVKLINIDQSNHLSILDIKKKYSEFEEKYPKLFENVVSKDFDIDNLKYMLNQMNEISENNLSQHDASVGVGGMLVDKYIKPNLPNL
jgi:hypothetical protein